VKSCRNPIPSLKHASDLVSLDSTKAGLFNDYFVLVFTSEDTSTLCDLRSHLPSQPHFILDNIKISETEVVEELKMLNVHKACGPDQICPRVLKEGADQLAPSCLITPSVVVFFPWNGLVPMLHLSLRREINTVSLTTDLLV